MRQRRGEGAGRGGRRRVAGSCSPSRSRRRHQRDGDGAAANDGFGDAAQEQALHARTAVRAHDNNVGALGFGCFHDGLGGGPGQDDGLRLEPSGRQFAGDSPGESVGRRFDVGDYALRYRDRLGPG